MILVNKIRCRKCGDEIESESVHDFKWCKCGACAVDGGHDYLRRLGSSEDIEELSVTDEDKETMRMFIDGEWKDVEIKRPEPEKTYDLYSEKYDVKGRIDDYSFVIKLIFEYNDRKYEIGIHRPLDGDIADKGIDVMEEAIERLSKEPKKAALHYWYLDNKEGIVKAHGNVTGHRKQEDSQFINTSHVVDTRFDTASGEMVIRTLNTEFHCPMTYCKFRKQDEFPELIENYEELKAKYKDKIEYPKIEQGKVLLVLSDFDDYYFHSLCVKNENDEVQSFSTYPHIGMFQDSFLIGSDHVDIRYFPHYRNIEFYSSNTGGRPLYAENIGSTTLYIISGRNTYRLDPGERKELKKENAEQEPPTNLPDGDLYPAGT